MHTCEVLLIGNVGNVPEKFTFPDGGGVVNLRVGQTIKWKDKISGENKEKTEWHNVVATKQTAEYVAKYVKQGDTILIRGVLRNRKWADTNGNESYVTEIVTNNANLLRQSLKNQQAQQANPGQSPNLANQPNNHQSPAQKPAQKPVVNNPAQAQSNIHSTSNNTSSANHTKVQPVNQPKIDNFDDIELPDNF